MQTIEQAEKSWLKNQEKHIYIVSWKNDICIHTYKAFFYFVIYDGKIISKHKRHDLALKSQGKNPMSIIKNAYELFGI
jgi:hypothetical protein